MPELVDIRDEQGNLTGETMLRSDAHRTERRHGVVLVWVYDSRGRILLQRRAAHLNAFPEKWDVSIAGHITSGDTPAATAARELLEELGLHASPDQLLSAGMFTDDFRVMSGKQHLGCDYVFLTRQDIDLDSLRLQAAEVQEVRWITADQLAADLAGPAATQYAARNRRAYRIVLDAARPLQPDSAGSVQ